MSFDGALIKEQGVTFAIAVVKPSVLTSPNKESCKISLSYSSIQNSLETLYTLIERTIIMANQHIVPNNGQWQVKRENATRATKTFDTQKEAIAYDITRADFHPTLSRYRCG